MVQAQDAREKSAYSLLIKKGQCMRAEGILKTKGTLAWDGSMHRQCMPLLRTTAKRERKQKRVATESNSQQGMPKQQTYRWCWP